jgi:pilus assembly protein Flp/PilA
MTFTVGRKRSEDGASSVEYGLLIALIAAVIVAVVILFGTEVTSLFKETCDSATTNGNVSGSCT